MIYNHVLPGQQAIHVEHRPWKQGKFYLGPCYATSTEKENERKFHMAPEDRNSSLSSLFGQHDHCWSVIEGGPHGAKCGLDIALLLSCRQIYHEAKYTFYATNTFSFESARALRAFMCRVERGPAANNLAIRKLHLEIQTGLIQDEYTWNKALSLMVRKLPGVNKVSVTIDRYPYWYDSGGQRMFTDPATGSNFFLRGILQLRKLPLSGLGLIVTDSGGVDDGTIEASMAAEELATQWTHAQRVEWARFVKGAVLRST